MYRERKIRVTDFSLVTKKKARKQRRSIFKILKKTVNRILYWAKIFLKNEGKNNFFSRHRRAKRINRIGSTSNIKEHSIGRKKSDITQRNEEHGNSNHLGIEIHFLKLFKSLKK